MTFITAIATFILVVAVLGNPTAENEIGADPTTESEMGTSPTTESEESGHLKAADILSK